MCEPATMAMIAVAGAGMSAYGQYQSGKYQSDIARENAKTAEYQGEYAARIGAIDEQNYLAKVRGVLGAQRARLGAAGVDPNTGTPLDMQTDTLQFGARDALTIRNNAAREAWGYRVEAVNSLEQGRLARSEAQYGAASTLLTGGAQAYGIYNQKK